MSVAANLDLVRRGYAAFSAGDVDTLRSVLASDVVHSVPGTSQISGDHKGVDSVLAFYGQLAELSGGTMTVELENVLSNGSDQVVSIHRSRATRNGQTLDQRESIVFTIRDGKVIELQDFFADIEANDRFWA
jgi:ketosteroid isomerase-like protein